MATNKIYYTSNIANAVSRGFEDSCREDNVYAYTAAYTVPVTGIYTLVEAGVGLEFLTNAATTVKAELVVEQSVGTFIIPLYIAYVAGATRVETIKTLQNSIGVTTPIRIAANANIYCKFTYTEGGSAPTSGEARWFFVLNEYTE